MLVCVLLSIIALVCYFVSIYAACEIRNIEAAVRIILLTALITGVCLTLVALLGWLHPVVLQ
jgi:hypothetical protein